MRSTYLVLWVSYFVCIRGLQDGRSARVRRFPFEIEAFEPSYGFIPDVTILYETVADALTEELDIQGNMADRYSKIRKGETDANPIASDNRGVDLNRLLPVQLQQVRSQFTQLQERFTALEIRISKIGGDLAEKDVQTTLAEDARIVKDSLQRLNAYLKMPDSATLKKDFFSKAQILNGTITDLLCSLSGTCSMKSSILEAFESLEKCHFDNLYGRVKDVFRLLRTGLQVHAVYIALSGSTLSHKYIEDVNEKSKRIIHKLRNIEQECSKEDEVAALMLRAIQENKDSFDPFEGKLATAVHGVLASRYSDKYWFVLIHHAYQEGPKHVRKFSDGFHQLLNVTLDMGRLNRYNKSEIYQLSAYAMSFSKRGQLGVDKQINLDLKHAFEEYKEVYIKSLVSSAEFSSTMSQAFSALEAKYGHLARFVLVNNQVRSYVVDTHWNGIKPLCLKDMSSTCYCALPGKSGESSVSRLSIPVGPRTTRMRYNVPVIRRVVGYTTFWGTKQITEQQASYFTHAIFAHVELLPDGSFRVGASKALPDAEAERDRERGNRRLNQLKAVKQLMNGRLKVLAGVIGWKNPTFFSQIASSSEQQEKIIDGLKRFLSEHEELDGLDIDWGYPSNGVSSSSNKDNSLQLLQKVRTMLNGLAVQQRRVDPYILTIATSVTPSALNAGYDWAKIADLVDWINVKSLDYYGDWSSNEKDERCTGPLAPLSFAGTKQFSSTRNVHSTLMDHLSKALPRLKSKIVLGVAFYGRYWTNVDTNDRLAGGRYPLKDSSKTGIVSWRDIHSKWIKANGFELKSFDSPNNGQYLFNTKEKILLTFDGIGLLQTKLDFAIDNELGGVAIWAVDMDTDSNMLLTTFSFKEAGEVVDTRTLLSAAGRTDRPKGTSRVRLTQGDGFSFGYVEVTNHAGIAGYIPATNWEDKDAIVVCKQLGFTAGVAIPSLQYPLPKSKITILDMENITCTGEEHDILQCKHDAQQAALRNASSLAAVVCHSENFFLSEISLSGGNLVSYGHVIVTHGQSGQSGYVCDNGWDDADANVICTQLGFRSGRARRGSFFGTVANGTFFGLDNVKCNGKERDILQCLHGGWKRHSCGRDQAAGVVCQTVDSPLSTVTLNGTNGLTYGQVIITNKSSGDISYAGKDDWDDTNAAVVCKQLGFGYGRAADIPSENYGWNNNLNEFNCTGSETDILQCAHENLRSFTLAGAFCKSHDTFRNRVVLNGSPTCGNGYSSGGVMLAAGMKNYGQICRNKWTDRDADGVCRLLGFPGGQVLQCPDKITYGSSSFDFHSYECPENATSVFECYVSYKSCPVEMQVTVKCNERPGRPVTLKKVPNSRRYLFRNTAKTERLLHAAATGNLTRVRDLISAGADVSQSDPTDFGLTALHKAAENGYTSIIEDLVSASANVNARDNAGWTPLHWASMAGRREAADLLMRSGADVDAKGVDGWAPLHHAAANGHALVVEALLLGGATVDARDNNGSTPLHWTAPDYKKVTQVKQNQTEILFNRQGNHHLAAMALIKHGADLHARDRHGRTPLHRAAMMYKKGEVVRALLQAGADIDAQDDEGWTPLHWAAHLYSDDAICILLRAGASKEIRTFKTKKTAHDVAYLSIWGQSC